MSKRATPALGREIGEEWARRYATKGQRNRLDKAFQDEEPADFVRRDFDAYGIGGWLANVIHDAHMDRSEHREFWEGVIGDEDEGYDWIYKKGFARGFLEGALGFIRQPKPARSAAG